MHLLPGWQNGNAANSKPDTNGWKGFCKYPPLKQVAKQGGPINTYGDTVWTTSIVSTIITINQMEYGSTELSEPVGDSAGITTNPCWPSVLTNDPGFALFTNDPWYNAYPAPLKYIYAKTPSGAITVGKSRPNFKRLIHEEYVEGFGIVDEGNSTRRATDEEMLNDFNMLKCQTQDCAKEPEEMAHAMDVALRGDWAAPPKPLEITSAAPIPEETPLLAPGSGVTSSLSEPSQMPSYG
jgi:hypothetical protein